MRAWKASWTTAQILMQAAGYAIHNGLTFDAAIRKAAETPKQQNAATAQLAPYTALPARTAFDRAIGTCPGKWAT